MSMRNGAGGILRPCPLYEHPRSQDQPAEPDLVLLTDARPNASAPQWVICTGGGNNHYSADG